MSRRLALDLCDHARIDLRGEAEVVFCAADVGVAHVGGEHRHHGIDVGPFPDPVPQPMASEREAEVMNARPPAPATMRYARRPQRLPEETVHEARGHRPALGQGPEQPMTPVLGMPQSGRVVEHARHKIGRAHV